MELRNMTAQALLDDISTLEAEFARRTALLQKLRDDINTLKAELLSRMRGCSWQRSEQQAMRGT